MGLFDSLAGALSGNSSHGALLDSVIGMIGDPQRLNSLADTFRNRGFGGVIESWIGTGQNLPISAEQIQQVLGNEHIGALAGKLGISHADISSRLAELLPQVIDKITPHGEVPSGAALQQALTMLKGKLG
jgi:uncharacterized protein YidB (DUF937 family)